MITRERLQEILNYDPNSGSFTWSKPTSNRVKVGSFAGSDNGNGYIRVRLDGRKYFHHRLAWLWVNGDIPDGHEIDHIDGNPSHNSIANLRLATRSENERNKRSRPSTLTGARGIERQPNGHFQVRVTVNGKRKSFGTFVDIDCAIARRNEVAGALHGQFARMSQ